MSYDELPTAGKVACLLTLPLSVALWIVGAVVIYAGLGIGAGLVGIGDTIEDWRYARRAAHAAKEG